VTPAELELALGGVSAEEALRGRVLAALPTVADWEGDLDRLDAAGASELVARADAILDHRFDLLGSGPTDLGREIDWNADFKAGLRWPSVHVSRLPFAVGDSSDIKVPWELSRFQHLPLLAAAARVTGDKRYLDEIGAQLDHWIEANPVEFGPNWYCTMDVAIRAANWVAALALCAEAASHEPWHSRALGSLLLHGRFIRTHLEWDDKRGNHYLSDVVGLLPVAALFSNGPEGRAWADWATGELVTEMEHQVRTDGCDHEASTSYHRLVCELFVCGTQAADALAPGRLPDSYRRRLELMLEFVRSYTRPDGLAPQVGDADDGRFLPLHDYGRGNIRSHLHLFRQARRPYKPAESHSAYPAGGYYVARGDGLYAIVRCGDTGFYGRGAHAHNDQLAFELALGTQPMVVDPGSYLYKSDPAARNLFRSTRSHGTLCVGGAEQNEMPTDRLFRMPDRSRAEALTWEAGEGRAVFEGRHHGFETLDPPAVHTRRFEFDCAARTLLIRDTVASSGSHSLEWTFPLMPCQAVARDGGATAEFEGGRLVIEADGLEFAIEDGWFSPSYGVRMRSPVIRARRRSQPGDDVTELILRAGPR
jgi:uncharacterized heparinase superfamily protein